MSGFEHIRVGVAVLVWHGGKVLMMKRASAHGRGTWSFPGGHIDKGETSEQATHREVMEETGLRLANVRIHREVPFVDSDFPESGRQYVTLYYEGDAENPGDMRIMEPGKCDELRWVDPLDLPHPLFRPIDSWAVSRRAHQLRG